jgi:hypothetical protein
MCRFHAARVSSAAIAALRRTTRSVTSPCEGQMQAHFFGFSLAANPPPDLNSFFQELATRPREPGRWGRFDRMLLVGERDGFRVGLFVTVKTQRKQCELKKDADGNFNIEVRKLDPNSYPMDFNFFVINTATYRGLYQHYYQSASLLQFGEYLKSQFSKVRKRMRRDELDNAANDAAKESVRTKFETSDFVFRAMARKADIEKFLGDISALRTFQVTYESLAAFEPYFEPVKEQLIRQTSELFFTADTPVGIAKKGILAAIEHFGPYKGTIEGTDEHGGDRILHLEEKHLSFETMDYDEIAERMTFKLDEFQTAPILGDMIESMKRHNTIMSTPAAS